MIKSGFIAFITALLISSPASQASEHQKSTNKQQPIVTSNQKISELLQTSLKHYPGRIIELERKQKNGAVYYEVKILSLQGNIIELLFQANQKGFTEIKAENEDSTKEQFSSKQGSYLSLNEFLKKLSFKTILDVKLEIDDAYAQYKVKWLDNQGQIHQAKFDAQTGKKLSP